MKILKQNKHQTIFINIENTENFKYIIFLKKYNKSFLLILLKII